MAAAEVPCIGFLMLVAEPVGAPPVVPPLGAVCWRAVGAARGEALLGVSAPASAETGVLASSPTQCRDGTDDDGTPATVAWLRPLGSLLAAIATCGALVDGRVVGVSPCGTRVLVRAAVRTAHVGGAPRTGAAAAAAALLVAHLRCDWEHYAAAAEQQAVPMQPQACGDAGCRCGCGANADAGADTDTEAAALTHTLGALLEDLRPPRVDASAPLVPKLDEARTHTHTHTRNQGPVPSQTPTLTPPLRVCCRLR
jgi:hypothetical protein